MNRVAKEMDKCIGNGRIYINNVIYMYFELRWR